MANWGNDSISVTSNITPLLNFYILDHFDYLLPRSQPAVHLSAAGLRRIR